MSNTKLGVSGNASLLPQTYTIIGGYMEEKIFLGEDGVTVTKSRLMAKVITLGLFLFSFAHEAEAEVFSDPHEYCRSVGKMDNPENDNRYRGPKATEKMASVFRSKLADMTVVSGDGAVYYTITWRCANGKVLACEEPNTPQCGPADTNRKPTLEMAKWCRENPNQGIPMAVTGHATIYDWNCVGKKAIAGRQFMQVDSEGYAIGLWKRVPR
jgi:hypothetical protein